MRVLPQRHRVLQKHFHSLLEIFLDALTSQCVLKTGVPYILEPKYKNLLSKPDIELKNIVDNFIEEMEKNDAVRKSSAFNTVDKMVRQLGGEIFFSNRSSYEVNNEEGDDRKNRIEIENNADALAIVETDIGEQNGDKDVLVKEDNADPPKTMIGAGEEGEENAIVDDDEQKED